MYSSTSNLRMCLAALLLFTGMAWCHAEWTVIIPESYVPDEAVCVALDDLQRTGDAVGVDFTVTTNPTAPINNAIWVGTPFTDQQRLRYLPMVPEAVQSPDHPQGFHIITMEADGKTILQIADNTLMGNVYGLYYIREQLRIHQEMTSINVVHEPDIDRRYTRIPVRSKEDIQRAQRYGLNQVYGENPLRLIPWDAAAEAAENEAHRAKTAELAAYAHSMHMKFIAFGTDFTYHPSLLEAFNATLNPEDPNFWKAVQEKYRRLFTAMPDLDGICTFTADEQRYWGNYKTFDFLHEGDSDWNFEKRYRTFIQKLHAVVVGEFGKELHCRTWANTMVELQSQPEVYRRIFTDDVPTENLFLIPSFTQNYRWWFQAYNPTVNQTPHQMMIVCESMDYHAGGLLFPTFPAAYYQAGLEGMLSVPDSNLMGVSFDLYGADDWQTRNLTDYSVQRLSWNYREDPRTIAEDFAAIHFGPKAAEGMGKLIEDSATAYKYGLYIEPAAYGQFNSFPHIRVGQFVAQGYNRIDSGREHIEFLKLLYLRCKPWMTETLLYLDHGLATAEQMVEDYAAIRPLIEDPALAKEVGQALDNTRLLILCNNRYVKTFSKYFEYREDPSEENEAALRQLHQELQAARDAFAASPGFRYKMFGIDQLLDNVQQMLDNRIIAETQLRRALTPDEIERIAAEEQAKYAAILEEHAGNAVKVAHWRLKVDGRDILRMQGDQLTVEHLRWDAPQVERKEVIAPLPRKEGVVIPKDLQSNPLHPFVLEQPSAENDYTVEIYCNDLPGGADWWEMEWYFLPLSADALGLRKSMKE